MANCSGCWRACIVPCVIIRALHLATRAIHTDIAIIGGGISGLWLLNLLQQQGYNTALVEKDALGSGQTLASQGMIHGGIKYALAGAATGASETIANMPARWRACLDGKGSFDLHGVRVLSRDYHLFSDSKPSSRIMAFLGSKVIRSRAALVAGEELPEALRHPEFSGRVYRLQDMVIDTKSLLQHLAGRHAQSIHIGPIDLRINQGRLAAIELNNGITLSANTYVLAAGEGNGDMIQQLSLPISMQLRPLNQVVVSGGNNLPEIYAHAVSFKSGDKPRLTMTSHRTGSGELVWYLGGLLAESGVSRPDREQVAFAKAELAAIFPWLSFDDCVFSTLRINRAEAGQAEGVRPDTPCVKRMDNVVLCWPTKLTLVPLMGDMLLTQLAPPVIGGHAHLCEEPLKLAKAPWERI